MIASVESLSSRRTIEWLTGSIFEPTVDSYLTCLLARGYLPSTLRGYLSAVAHFGHWCKLEGFQLPHVNDGLVARFLERHIPRCRCATRCMREPRLLHSALFHLLQRLRGDGVIAAMMDATVPPLTVSELHKFDDHLRTALGLAATTRHLYVRLARAFLVHQFRGDAVSIQLVQPSDVARFVEQRTVGYKRASIKAVNTALASYFAFKEMQGGQTSHLLRALPRVALWRMATLPKIVASEDIDRLFRAYDRTTASGKRGYAIARCVIDLGLRRAEVARLKLEDIQWREAVLLVPGKGQRVDRLPLPEPTGRAIADYLRHGRPSTDRREVFVRHRAPYDRPADVDLVRTAIRKAAARCGLKDTIRGTHVLRHTLAGRLVQSGTPLKEISDLLRHRSLDTTTIYAKVDLPALARVAMPWPGSQT